MYRSGPSYLGAIYLIIGVVVAATHGYMQGLGSLSAILSALLAVVAWPALLFGADLHIGIGM